MRRKTYSRQYGDVCWSSPARCCDYQPPPPPPPLELLEDDDEEDEDDEEELEPPPLPPLVDGALTGVASAMAATPQLPLAPAPPNAPPDAVKVGEEDDVSPPEPLHDVDEVVDDIREVAPTVAAQRNECDVIERHLGRLHAPQHSHPRTQ